MPTLTQSDPAFVIETASTRHSLALFSLKDIQEVEGGFFEKNKKPYVKCFCSGKDRPAKPEELVRQLWLRRLHRQYNYPLDRIQIEYPITFGRDTSKRADIVVMDVDRPTVPYLIVEVKAAKLKDGKDQLKSYCHATGAPLALWSNGGDAHTYLSEEPKLFHRTSRRSHRRSDH